MLSSFNGLKLKELEKGTESYKVFKNSYLSCDEMQKFIIFARNLV